MREIKIEDIVIVGGGMSGWLAALTLEKDYNITIIESPDISIIGVGESTQPGLIRFMADHNFSPSQWMPEVSATYKLGVMFEGWSNNKFMVDSESHLLNIVDTTEDIKINIHDICIANKTSTNEYFNCFPPYRMAIENKSPCFSDERFNYLGGNATTTNKAVHWDNRLMVDALKKECLKRNITFIQDTVVDVNLDEDGYVKEIITNNSKITGDLYLDCTGFKSMLLSKLDVSWNSIENHLYNNNAVAIRKQYTNPQEECHPYTKATAMNSGWMWSIPTYKDIAYGYVYSDKYIDKDEAEKELRLKIDEWEASAFHVPFRTGAVDRVAYKNVCGIGNSVAFIEPLEATNFTFTTEMINYLRRILAYSNNRWNPKVENSLHILFDARFKELLFFIFMHFHSANKNDTLYWQDTANTPLPGYAKNLYNKLKDYPISQSDLVDYFWDGHPFTKDIKSDYITMFHNGHWWQLLKGNNWYENAESPLSDDVVKYGNAIMDINKYRVDKVIKLFPNHYDYLTKWYESC